MHGSRDPGAGPTACTRCNASVPEGARFCVACGAPAGSACPACGHVAAIPSNFCAQCGARLDPAAPPGAGAAAAPRAGGDAPVLQAGPAERRQLTVLFCDLVDSTGLSLRLDPEDLRELLGAYHRCIADVSGRFDGFVARYMGDGALVYFGYPVGHEDNAERALNAALTIVDEVGRLTSQGEPLRVRIGVATGLVVVGAFAHPGAPRERIALGETPNLAARLQAIAEPDTIVISEGTRRVAGARFVYRDLGSVTLKGFHAAQRAWRVVAPARTRRSVAVLRPAGATGPAAPASVTPLVGREQELGLLRDRWEQAVEGDGHVVLVTGEAGIGKSRLVQTLVETATAHPHVLLELRCSAQYANTPLYPVIALLPGILGWSRADSDEAKLAKLGRFGEQNGVSRAEGVPLLMSLLGMAPSERFPLAPMSPELQKQRTLQTLAGAALAVAARQPVLAVVEDLHWIDPTTLELLSSLVDQIPTVPFLVVLTARLGFQAPWPPHSHVTPLVLTRFSKRQAAQMVAHIAGTTPLPEDVVSQIVLRTDGVPLFVEELSKLVVESRVVAPESAERTPTGPPPELAIPATLQDSLEARLDRLSTVKVIAQLGATLGREFPYALLRAVSDLDDAVLERELGRLVDAELLYQRGAAPEATYVFKHALIQEAAYQSLLRGTRQQYHQRVARVMVEQFSAEAEAHPEYVARHFTDGADVPSAVQWWRKAGQHAFRRAAFREAAAHFGKGLGVVSAAPPSGRRDQMELGLQVELGYALIPIRGWASPEAAAAFTRAGELSRQTGDTPALFRALWGLAAFHFVRGDQRRASEVAEQCLATAKAADDADALSAAHYLCGITACVMGKFAEGQRELEACVRLFRDETRESHRALYGQDAKASALGWLAMALWVMGQPDAALDRAEQAAAHVRDANQPFLLARGLASIGFVRVFRGDPQGPDSPLQQALDLCVEQGFTYFQAVVSAFQGTNLVHLGRTADGVAMMQASIAALRRIGSELLFTVILANLAAAQLALERIDEGLATVAEGLECVERTGEHWAEAELHRLRGELLLALGDSAAGEPEACFARALQVARAQQAAAYEARAANALERCRVV